MKQLLKKSLVLVVMFTTITGYSNVSSLITSKMNNYPVNVTFENVNQGTKLLVKDNYGHVLYEEIIEKTGKYSKEFDLTNLPDADYYYELDNMQAIRIIPFSVQSSVAEFVKDEEYEILKPNVTVRDNIVYVSKQLSHKQSLEIEVYNEDFDLAYSERLVDAYSLNRVYDFSGSKKGNYTIIVKSEGRIFKNNVTI